MSFHNKVRLPFYLSKPQRKVEREIYVRTSGDRDVTDVEITKEYDGTTDWIPDNWHDALHIALLHDKVSIVSKKFEGRFFLSNEYEVQWQEQEYPVAPAKFRGLLIDWTKKKTSCDVCEELFQSAVAYGEQIGPKNEGDIFDVNVKDNDILCCDDPVYSVEDINSTYVESATIDPATGIVTIEIKDPAPPALGVWLVLTKVTCGDIEALAYVSTDEIVGTGILPPNVCEPPTAVTTDVSPTGAQPARLATWTNPVTYPTFGVEGGLYSVVGMVETLVTSFAINDPLVNQYLFTGLLFNTDYIVKVRSKCSDAPLEVSTWASSPVFNFVQTPPEEMTISVYAEETPAGGGLSDYDVVAQIIIPGAVTSSVPIDIFGTLDLSGSGTFLFMLTIPAGTTVASVTVTNQLSGQGASVIAAAPSPTTVVGSDLITYNIIIQL